MIIVNSKRNHWLFQRFAGIFSRVYSSRLNPLYHLGGIAILMFVLACVSGVYLFLFYDVDPAHAYQSVERISANPIHGVIRSVHRYSSDLLVIFIVLHFFQTLFTGKYKRILSWVSGIISLLIVLIIGVTGFILVWDEKGKLVGYLTAKFFSAIPLFDPSIAGSFISNNLDIIGGFFKVSVFGHIFFSIFLVIVLWLHVMRIAKPKLFSPKIIWLYSGIALLLVCIVFPVKSDPSAQERYIPYNTTFDWYYFFGYSFMKIVSVPMNWVIMISSGTILAIVPFIFREKKKPAVIDLDKCDACKICSEDCPYGAIDMLIYKGERKAILAPDKCTSCGICLASCKEYAITMPGVPEVGSWNFTQRKQLSVVACERFDDVKIPDGITYEKQTLPCLGDLHMDDVEHSLDSQSDGVLLLGCEDCYYRYGRDLAVARINRKRPPFLSKKYSLNRIELITANHYSEKAVKDFVSSLPGAMSDTGRGSFKMLDYVKTNHILSVLILCAFFMIMPLFSNTKISFFDKNEKLLVLNFKYISSPTEFQETTTNQQFQMQSAKPIVKRRSPINVVVTDVNGKTIFEKEYSPRGLRKDIAIFVYNEITTKDSVVNIKVTETAFPETGSALNNVTLNKNDGTIISFADGKLEQL